MVFVLFLVVGIWPRYLVEEEDAADYTRPPQRPHPLFPAAVGSRASSAGASAPGSGPPAGRRRYAVFNPADLIFMILLDRSRQVPGPEGEAHEHRVYGLAEHPLHAATVVGPRLHGNGGPQAVLGAELGHGVVQPAAHHQIIL